MFCDVKKMVGLVCLLCIPALVAMEKGAPSDSANSRVTMVDFGTQTGKNTLAECIEFPESVGFLHDQIVFSRRTSVVRCCDKGFASTVYKVKVNSSGPLNGLLDATKLKDWVVAVDIFADKIGRDGVPFKYFSYIRWDAKIFTGIEIGSTDQVVESFLASITPSSVPSTFFVIPVRFILSLPIGDFFDSIGLLQKCRCCDPDCEERAAVKRPRLEVYGRQDRMCLLHCGHVVHTRHIGNSAHADQSGALMLDVPYHCPCCNALIEEKFKDCIDLFN